MREIKFRAWDKYSKVGEMIFPNGGDLIGWHGPSNWKDCYDIMQFTGLKDKNGKDIYEGDIVKILYTDWPSKGNDSRSLEQYLDDISHIGRVIWDDSLPGWSLLIWSKKYGEWHSSSIHYGPHGQITVIGNIYQNPDLL